MNTANNPSNLEVRRTKQHSKIILMAHTAILYDHFMLFIFPWNSRACIAKEKIILSFPAGYTSQSPGRRGYRAAAASGAYENQSQSDYDSSQYGYHHSVQQVDQVLHSIVEQREGLG